MHHWCQGNDVKMKGNNLLIDRVCGWNYWYYWTFIFYSIFFEILFWNATWLQYQTPALKCLWWKWQCINCINNLKEEIVNLKNIVIKRLQDEHEKLKAKCSTLENKMATLKQNLNSLGQYGRRNNLVLSDIPESIPDNQLENTVASILSDVGVSIQSEEIEACHRFGKTDRKTKSKKYIICFVNRKHCK